ncbi:hypothetical protein ACROYT_G029412 [Oculina patagonica]
MSQLPPPNFANFPPAFNMSGFSGWPPRGTAPSIFGGPQSPSLGFPPRLPMNSFTGYPGSQFRPGMWPNVNSVRPQQHHVVAQDGSQAFPQQHQRPQVTNFQGKTNAIVENGQNCPLNKDYSCDACQRDFNSKETLNAHLTSHVQCNYEGCTFKAGKKVLKLHWIQTHETGRMRIKLDTPEEIAKWKEERKRKYPTLANVERKMAEDAKRKESGHVLKTKNFRYRRGQRGGRMFHRGGHNHFSDRGHTRKSAEGSGDMGTATTEQSEDENKERTAQDPTRLENGEDPLSFVLDGCCDEKDGTGSGIKERLSTQKVLSSMTSEAGPSNVMSGTSALGSLCSAYASESEDDKEPTEVNNNKHTDCSPSEKDIKRSTSEPQYVKSTLDVRHKVNKEEHSRTSRPRKGSRKNASKANSKSMGIRKSTLLEKLLAPEIRHERNVILQCLRHVVKRNFFDVDVKLPSESVVKNEVNCDEFVNKS